jgi:c(7)-type cytochrome triheme protein
MKHGSLRPSFAIGFLGWGLVMLGAMAWLKSDVALAQAQTQAPAPAPRALPCDPIMLSGLEERCAGTGDLQGFAGEEFQAGMGAHPPALELSNLPKDRFGLIDWADALKSGAVQPKHSLNPTEPDQPPLDMDIVIYSKSKTQPDVIFPHKIHTMWLTCINCHPAIFPMNAKEANKMMTMPKIASGEFCGRCHNRIAFPLSDCLRCHVKPRDVPPIDPDAEQWGITPIKIPD